MELQPIWRRRLPLWLVVLLIGMALFAGVEAGRRLSRPTAACPDTRAACESFERFWQVWRLVRSEYIDAAAADPQLMTEGAIRGMLEALGDVGHTRFLAPGEVGRPEPGSSVRWAMLGGDLALVRLGIFADETGVELRQALQQAGVQGARAIILDLRDNPGGLVDEMVRAAGQFLPRGTTVLIEERRDGSRRPTRARSGGAALDLPLVVLVNQRSASAAEILAGALQAARRAPIVGAPTFGAGTMLTTFPLRGGARLLLGTAWWRTADDRLIHRQGLAPDLLVTMADSVAPLEPAEAAGLSLAELAGGPDVQLARAIELALAARP